MAGERKPQCLNCKYAKWEVTAAGRLHPPGDGRCTWQMPAVRLPVSMWFFGSIAPCGGHINRKDEWRQCPQFQPKDTLPVRCPLPLSKEEGK